MSKDFRAKVIFRKEYVGGKKMNKESLLRVLFTIFVVILVSGVFILKNTFNMLHLGLLVLFVLSSVILLIWITNKKTKK